MDVDPRLTPAPTLTVGLLVSEQQMTDTLRATLR